VAHGRDGRVVGPARKGKPLVFVHTFTDVSAVVPFLAAGEKRSVAEIALAPAGPGRRTAARPEGSRPREAKVETV
jgi:hypothetical protein